MHLSRRHFFRAASGAAAIGALAERSASGTQPGQPLTTRDDFPASKDYTFLNTAYIGLIARPVVEAGRAWLDARAGKPLEVGTMVAKVEECRHWFGGLMEQTHGGARFVFE